MVNSMSVRAMLNLSILRELHTKLVDFFLAYIQDYLKTEIFNDLPIRFGVDGDHPIEWVIRIDTHLYGVKDTGLAWFYKLKEGLGLDIFPVISGLMCMV